MGKFNEDVIGEKIIYKGHPAIIEDFVSCYEGDYWVLFIRSSCFYSNNRKDNSTQAKDSEVDTN